MQRLVRALMLFLLAFAAGVQPAAAQSLLRDAETEAFLADASRPLIIGAGLSPGSVDIVLLHDKSINAFVAAGQKVHIHSGLLVSADSVGELQGVIAHELGHVAGGHVIRIEEGAKMATGIMLLSLLLGAAAMAAGSPEAGSGLMQLGQQAALGKFLAFTRTQEAATDQAGAKYMEAAGVSGRGTLAFFKKLQNLEFRLAIPQEDSYARTHPLNGERIQALENVFRASPAWDKPFDPALEARFQRVKAKLIGFVEEPPRTFVRYPMSDKTPPARYARAYALHRGAYVDRALAEVDALIAGEPANPYFRELKGQILLESGRPKDALATLREAVRLAPDQPLIAALLGHALISTEDPANIREARAVLKTAVQRDNDNPFAWYQLGIVYAREGDDARAALATAERHSLQGNPLLAMTNARLAMAGIKPGTPDCLRAEDIALASRAEIQRARKANASLVRELDRAERRTPPISSCRGVS